MNSEVQKQEKYWDNEVSEFDAIYTHEKSMWQNIMDRVFRWDMYERFNFTMKYSEPIENRTILDVGCGTGKFAIEFAIRKAQKVLGIDIAENMIKVCQQRAAKAGVEDRATFIKVDLFGLNRNEQFDVCIGIGLFDYVSDPLPLLQLMKKYARHSVIVSFPKLLSWRALVRKVRLNLRGCAVYFYTPKQLNTLMNTAGFKSYRLEKIGQLYCIVAYIQ